MDQIIAAFTLDELAHFDRCLFPDSFRRELLVSDASIVDADGVALFIAQERQKGNNVGIIRIYQEFGVGDDNLARAITDVAQRFVAGRK